jgi:hypothetical protein
MPRGRVVGGDERPHAGEGKTDAKAGYVVAETAQLCRDLAVTDADADLVRSLPC